MFHCNFFHPVDENKLLPKGKPLNMVIIVAGKYYSNIRGFKCIMCYMKMFITHHSR
jgi:hypothetical protein